MQKNVSKRLVIGFYTFILAVSAFNVLVFLSMRPFWFFIDRDTKTPLHSRFPFSYLILTLYFVFFICALIFFILNINKQKSFIKRPHITSIVIPTLFTFLFSVFNLYIYSRMEGDQYLVNNYLHSINPYILILGLILILIFFNPKLKISVIPMFYYTAIFIAVLVLILNITDFGKVKITSGPNVQALDNNKIAILWTTNKNSTEFVEYGTDKEHLKRAFNSTDGLISANTKVHKVILPLKKQGSIIYRVISTKINHYYQNNVDYGNTASSTFKKYTDISTRNNISFYILDDIHENTNIYKKFLSKDDYDFVVLNGDMLNTVDSTSDITLKMLKPLSQYINGEKPFYISRGNHETRGGASRDLLNYLALPNNHFYYTFSAGPVFGIVLDSAEDKLDTDKEYSGLADFKSYRQEETNWLQGVYNSKLYATAKYKLAFVHIPLNMDDNNIMGSYLKTYQSNWRDLLNKIKVDAVISGHTHVPAIIQPNNRSFNFPTFIGGGPTDNEKKYIAIKIEATLSNMKIYFVGFDGSSKEVYNITRR
jgi:acid phosphatase type 7